MTAIHELVGGKVQLFKRERSSYWWCSATIGNTRHRVSTKTNSLSEAKAFAQDWVLELTGKNRWGEGVKKGKTFAVAAQRFLDEFEVITQGQRSPIYVQGHKDRVRNHLIPFFGDMVLTEITSGDIQDYRIHRMKTGNLRKGVDENGERRRGNTPARSTLHQELVCIRQVLKTAHRHGWLPHLPDLSTPYRANGKISHRAWFSPTEYKQLYEATRERAKNPKKERWRDECKNLHDFILFMVNTGLRPDEALRLEYRDVEVVTDEATRERILEIEVRGKRGVGYCKSMPGAVHPFNEIKGRNKGKPTDRIFPSLQRELFNTVLEELGMKTDREGQPRTFYSLRHTYICMRLMEGADIYQIAKNCRTSVEMIEKFYASHIKNTLDTAAINVRRPRKRTTKSMDKPRKPPSRTKSRSTGSR